MKIKLGATVRHKKKDQLGEVTRVLRAADHPRPFYVTFEGQKKEKGPFAKRELVVVKRGAV